MLRRYIVLEFVLLRKLLITGILVASFFALYYSRKAGMFQFTSLEGFLLLSYGNLNIDEIKYVIPIVFWVLPQVCLLYFMGEHFSNHLNRSAVYIFTRTSQRKMWLLAKVISLFFYVLFYYAVQLVVIGILGNVMGFHMVDWSQGVTVIVSMSVLEVLFNYMIILIINLLSLNMNLLYSSVIVLTVDFVCLFLSQYLEGMGSEHVELIKWLPFTQGILSWHENVPTLGAGHGLFDFHVQGFSMMFSVVYLSSICVVSIYWGVRKIENMDIL